MNVDGSETAVDSSFELSDSTCHGDNDHQHHSSAKLSSGILSPVQMNGLDQNKNAENESKIHNAESDQSKQESLPENDTTLARPCLSGVENQIRTDFSDTTSDSVSSQLNEDISLSNSKSLADSQFQTASDSNFVSSSSNNLPDSGIFSNSEENEIKPNSINAEEIKQQSNNITSFENQNSEKLTFEMVKRKKQSESFVIEFPQKAGNFPKKKLSSNNLQDGFQKFQQMKIDQLKQQRKLRKAQEKRKQKERAMPHNMWNLRMRFLMELKKYLGVPYAKRYFKPGEPEFESKIFLDCCGLVRRALWNLQFLFGFRIGPWNQAYMFDTLPIDIQDEKDMKPGDLVFISGTYNEGVKFKNSPHNMKHIEVWLGKGQKVIGSRWQRGTVSIFDSYKFESKSYSNMVYYFKSIDTWLKGICKSHCEQHPWKSKRPIMFSEKSVFAKKARARKNKTSAEPDERKSKTNTKENKSSKKSSTRARKRSAATKTKSKNKLSDDPETVASEEFVTDFGDLEIEGQQGAEEEDVSDIDENELNNEELLECDDDDGADIEGADDCLNDGMGEDDDDDDEVSSLEGDQESQAEELNQDEDLESSSSQEQQSESTEDIKATDENALLTNPFDDI